MSRRRKDPLRTLTDDERQELVRLSHSRTAPAVRVARAVSLLAVAGGSDTNRRRGRPDARAVTPFPTWSPGSTVRGWRHSTHATAGDTSRPMMTPHATGSYARPHAPRRPRPTVPAPGR
jgi:hypothetical protein